MWWQIIGVTIIETLDQSRPTRDGTKVNRIETRLISSLVYEAYYNVFAKQMELSSDNECLGRSNI